MTEIKLAAKLLIAGVAALSLGVSLLSQEETRGAAWRTIAGGLLAIATGGWLLWLGSQTEKPEPTEDLNKSR